MVFGSSGITNVIFKTYSFPDSIFATLKTLGSKGAEGDSAGAFEGNLDFDGGTKSTFVVASKTISCVTGSSCPDATPIPISP